MIGKCKGCEQTGQYLNDKNLCYTCRNKMPDATPEKLREQAELDRRRREQEDDDRRRRDDDDRRRRRQQDDDAALQAAMTAAFFTAIL